MRGELGAVAVDNVTRKHYHVGVESIDLIDHAGHKRGVGAKCANMQIAYLHHPEAVEGLREVGHSHFNTLYVGSEAIDKGAVPHTTEQRDSKRSSYPAHRLPPAGPEEPGEASDQIDQHKTAFDI